MTTNTIVSLTDQTLDATLARSERVLLDFTAERCAPCRTLLPILARIAASSGPELVIAKVDADAYPELAVRFGVRALPTLVLLEQGQEVARHVGSSSEARVRALLDRPHVCRI